MKALWKKLRQKSGSNGRLWLFVLILAVPVLAMAGVIRLTKAWAIRSVFLPTKYRGAISSLIKLARYETGDYTSGLYTKDNNLWGMGIARVRPQVLIGVNPTGEDGRPTAIYKDDYQSAQDMLLWLKYHNPESSEIEGDAAFLKYLAKKQWWGVGIDRSGTYLKAFEQW